MTEAGMRTDALLPHFFTITRMLNAFCVFDLDTLHGWRKCCNIVDTYLHEVLLGGICADGGLGAVALLESM
jgi:hypothetical protein